MRPLQTAYHEVRSVLRAGTPTHEHLRDRIFTIFWVSFVLDVVASIAIFFLERGAKGSEINDVGSAFFWVSGQLLTVSSQLKNPITPAARVIDIFLELYAITVVATLAGSFGSFFHRRSHERAGPPAHASSD
jgi:hypothetical protein